MYNLYVIPHPYAQYFIPCAHYVWFNEIPWQLQQEKYYCQYEHNLYHIPKVKLKSYMLLQRYIIGFIVQVTQIDPNHSTAFSYGYLLDKSYSIKSVSQQLVVNSVTDVSYLWKYGACQDSLQVMTYLCHD